MYCKVKDSLEWGDSIREHETTVFKPIATDLKVDYIHGGKWFHSFYVTHWMPLPKLPESEDDAERLSIKEKIGAPVVIAYTKQYVGLR